MQQLLVHEVPVGARLATPVLDPLGRPIFQAGTVLEETHLKVLHRLATGTVSVQDTPHVVHTQPPAQIGPETMAGVTAFLTETLEGVRNPGDGARIVPSGPARRFARLLMTEVRATFRRPILIEPIRAGRPYEVLHPIQSAIIALRLGVGMNLPDADLERLAVGAMLLDIGNLVLPSDLGQHPGPLSDDDKLLIQRHPLLGQDLLKRNGFDPIVCAIVLQHHEGWSGNGYPHRRAGKQIFRLARILGPAAAYVSLISDRPHRKGYLPHEALECLVAYAGDLYDAEVVQSLVSTLPAYPFGTRVLLDGDIAATVIDANAIQPGRPVVRLDDGALVDLGAGEHLQRSIVGLCPTLAQCEAPE